MEDKTPQMKLKMALRCPSCGKGNLRPMGEGSRMRCPDCGFETPLPKPGQDKG